MNIQEALHTEYEAHRAFNHEMFVSYVYGGIDKSEKVNKNAY